MISQAPLDIQIENLLALIHKAGLEVGAVQNAQTLSNHYLKALEGLQGRKSKGAFQLANMVFGHDDAMAFSRLLSDDALTSLDDKGQAEVICLEQDPLAQQKTALLRAAVERLGVLSPEHKSLFDFLITDIFLMPSRQASGGSTSCAIGVIWANPKPTYRIPDVVEFLVHELTHHAMFIDEHRHGHYDYSVILRPETWAQSALLRAPRPLDKVIHSIVVAVEIVMFREKYLGHPATPLVHPPTSRILPQIVASLDAAEQVIDALEGNGETPVSPRVNALLRGARGIVESDCFAESRAAPKDCR